MLLFKGKEVRDGISFFSVGDFKTPSNEPISFKDFSHRTPSLNINKINF